MAKAVGSKDSKDCRYKKPRIYERTGGLRRASCLCPHSSSEHGIAAAPPQIRNAVTGVAGSAGGLSEFHIESQNHLA